MCVLGLSAANTMAEEDDMFADACRSCSSSPECISDDDDAASVADVLINANQEGQ